MLIRWAHPEDAPELFALNEAFNGANCNTLHMMEHSLKRNTQESIAVAEIDGKLIGFCCGQRFWSMCYENMHAEITELYVNDAHRRQGVASALMKFLEDSYTADGIHHLHVLTGTKNHQAQALYEALGYQQDSEIMYRKRPKED